MPFLSVWSMLSFAIGQQKRLNVYMVLNIWHFNQSLYSVGGQPCHGEKTKKHGKVGQAQGSGSRPLCSRQKRRLKLLWQDKGLTLSLMRPTMGCLVQDT